MNVDPWKNCKKIGNKNVTAVPRMHTAYQKVNCKSVTKFSSHPKIRKIITTALSAPDFLALLGTSWLH